MTLAVFLELVVSLEVRTKRKRGLVCCCKRRSRLSRREVDCVDARRRIAAAGPLRLPVAEVAEEAAEVAAEKVENVADPREVDGRISKSTL